MYDPPHHSTRDDDRRHWAGHEFDSQDHSLPVLHLSDDSYPLSVQSNGCTLFRNTLKDLDERFNSTFPAARKVAIQARSQQDEQCYSASSSLDGPYGYDYASSSSESPLESTVVNTSFPSSLYTPPPPAPISYNGDRYHDSHTIQAGVSSSASSALDYRQVHKVVPKGILDPHSVPTPRYSMALNGRLGSSYSGQTTIQSVQEVPVVPSQDYPPSLLHGYQSFGLQQSHAYQSPPPMNSLDEPVGATTSQYTQLPLRITPNPNLRVQDIIIPPSVEHSSVPSYTSGNNVHSYPQAPTHELIQYSRPSELDGYSESRDEEVIVPPSRSPSVEPTGAETRSPLPQLPQDPMEPEETPGSNKKDDKVKQGDKKPHIACLFCRDRKIACRPPVPSVDENTCKHCHRRSLKCEYPLESRRGMRKKRSISNLGESESKPPPPKVAKTKR